MNRSFITLTGIAAVLTFAGSWFATAPAAPVSVPATVVDLSAINVPPPRIERPEVPRDAEPRTMLDKASTQRPATSIDSVYYSGCNQARAAGAAPIHRGDPGYREGVDGDHDGIACEPRPGV